jgi:hypothetical protein
MSVHPCPREQDVLDAVVSGRWPERCDATLRAHVDGCAACADLAEVAAALRDEHEATWAAARVPPAGLVWWRAEMRARREATRVATRPILVVQLAAGLCALAIGAAVLVALGGSPLSWAQDLARWLAAQAAPAAAPPTGPRLALLIALGAWVLAVPVGVYWALRD